MIYTSHCADRAKDPDNDHTARTARPVSGLKEHFVSHSFTVQMLSNPFNSPVLSSSGPHDFVVMSRTVRVLRLTFSPSPPLVLLLLFRSLVRLWRGWIIFCLRLFHRQRVTGSSPGSAECRDSIHTARGCRRLPRHCTISGELVAVALFAVCVGEPGEGIYYQTFASDPTLEGL